MSNKQTLNTLSAAPFGHVDCARTPVLIKDEILFSPFHDNHIWKFNTISNQWTKYEFGNHANIAYHAMCVSNDRQKIFLFDSERKILLIIDIKTMKVIKKINHKIMTGYNPVMICDPNNEELIHIIGGMHGNKHYTFDIENGRINTIHTFEYGLMGAGIVFIKSKKEFLLFHQKIPIHSYNLRSEKWRNTNIKMPTKEKAYNFGYVMTKNEKYVIIIAGANSEARQNSNNILIYDIINSKYVKCPIKLQETESGMANAVITNNGIIHIFQRCQHFTMNINNILKNSNIKIESKQYNKSEINQFETEQKQNNNNEWNCDICTYNNSNNNGKCEMCEIGTNPNNKTEKDGKERIKLEKELNKKEFEMKEMEQKWNESKENENNLQKRLEKLELEKFQRIKFEKEKKEMEQRLKQLQKQFQKNEQKIENKNVENSENILREWNLSQYINTLIIDNGYEDIQDWIHLSLNELKEMGFKPGHSRKFQRKVKQYFKPNNNNNNDNNEVFVEEGADGYDGTLYM
eukprot:520542_1